jgi:NADH:ubiquinone oxidoreductase subunit 6 (subunit J)
MASLNPVGVAMLTWLAMLLLGACGAALFTRFELESLLGAPVVVMVIAVVLVPRVVHALIPGITQESLLRFLQQPTTPLVLATVLLAAVGLVGAVAFGITSRGFAIHRPDVTRR